MSPLYRWLLAMTYAGLTLAAVITAHDWWKGQLEDPRWYHWLLLASLPVLAWIYLRHLCVFAPGNGRCLLPVEHDRSGRQDG